jgi:glycosyltransferase involved in cell wall biosynthesis
MHVLMTADTLGGVWTYVRELTTELVRRRVRVTLVSFGEIPTLEQTAWMDALDLLDHRPTGFKLEWMQECDDDLAASAEYLRMVVSEVQPDLLHFNQYFYGALDFDQPAIVVAHSDVVSWWQSVHKTDPPESPWIRNYRRIVSRGLASADAVVAPSFASLAQLESNFVRPHRTQVIHNGRNPALFNPHQDKDGYATSVGRVWDLGKNAALLTKIETPWPIYVAGDNANPDLAVKPTALHVGDGRVVFKGVMTENQLRALYARASIYIATSQYEPFGLAPLEAALSRCAILASDIPSFREVWGDDVVYFRSNDRKSLEAELFRLCADPAHLKKYGDLALARARRDYTSVRMAEEYLALYRSLIPAGVVAA